MILSRTIRLFLDSIGRSEEYEYYFKKFQAGPLPSFALLCPDYDTLAKARDVFILQLHYLLRMELYPTVLLSGPRAAEEAQLLEDAARPLFRFYRFVVTTEQGATQFHRRELEQARAAESLPLAIVPAGLPRAALELNPGRMLFVRMAGSLKDTRGDDLLHFLERRPVPVAPEDEALLELARTTIRRRPDLHLAITAPANILKEIFTVKGAGTVVQTGHKIRAIQSRSEVDEDRLLSLIEESFARTLAGTNFLDEITDYLIEETYQGAVLLAGRENGAYLSKFAVGKGARGAGIAQELWEEARARHPVIYWRSRGNNSINRWYARLADGLQKDGDWTVYWVGARPEDIPEIIAYCTGRPEDLSREE